MTAVGCGTVEVNPPQHSIKRREKCGLSLGERQYDDAISNKGLIDIRR